MEGSVFPTVNIEPQSLFRIITKNGVSEQYGTTLLHLYNERLKQAKVQKYFKKELFLRPRGAKFKDGWKILK